MQITLDLPDELLQHFNPNQLSLEILKALAMQAYQTEKITSGDSHSSLSSGNGRSNASN
jgi:hypothetical protein